MYDSKTTQSPPSSDKNAMQLSISWRALTMLLLVVIVVITYLWKPWSKPAATRTITVQGEATVTATPDQFVFEPVFKNPDLKTATATGNEVVTQLKKIGVADTDIKTSISSISAVAPDSANSTALIYPRPTSSNATYLITATVHDQALAQKVGDYLATTPATGQVTPSATFSKALSSKLDLQARSQASDDAKSKATVTAKQLNAKLGQVIKISDSSSGIYALDAAPNTISSQPTTAVGFPIQPGTNDVKYSFTVEFELQ